MKAANADVKLLVFPEMCITGYWHVIGMNREEIAALAEPIPNGPSTQTLLKLAKDHNMVIGAGLIEAAGDIKFTSKKFSKGLLKINIDEDIYSPLLKSVKWQKGNHCSEGLFL